MWWRIFIPTWRFFDLVGANPQLFVRTQGDWQAIIARPAFTWHTLFFNPQGNFYHACNNLLERLAGEVAENDAAEVSNLVSYQLVKNLALQHALKTGASDFCFKITVNNEDLLLSPSYPVTP